MKIKDKIIKLIEEDIRIQKVFLKGDYEKDKPIAWRIVGMIKLKKDIKKIK